MKKTNWNVLGPIAVITAFFGTWYLLAYNLDNNFSPASGKPLVLPPPHRLFEDVNHHIWSEIFVGLRITAVTAATGLIIAFTVGVTLALLMSRTKWLERSLWPLLIALQATPVIALVPLIIQIIGVNYRARTLVVVLISFFPIVANTLHGLQSAPTEFHDLMTMYKAKNWQRMRKLEVPHALPDVVNGLRIATGLSIIGAIVGDFFFARGDLGLGKLITQYFANNQPGPMIVASLVAVLLGILTFIAVGYLSRYTRNKWSPTVGTNR